MRRKLRQEIRELIDERTESLRCNLYSTDIKHRIYGSTGFESCFLLPTHSLDSVLDAILDHCGLELGHVTRKEQVVVKKKEKPPVVYKKRTVRG
jgi:hypothetical protein